MAHQKWISCFLEMKRTFFFRFAMCGVVPQRSIGCLDLNFDLAIIRKRLGFVIVSIFKIVEPFRVPDFNFITLFLFYVIVLKSLMCWFLTSL